MKPEYIYVSVGVGTLLLNAVLIYAYVKINKNVRGINNKKQEVPTQKRAVEDSGQYEQETVGVFDEKLTQIQATEVIGTQIISQEDKTVLMEESKTEIIK